MILAMTLRNSDEPIAFESPSKPFAASALGASAWRRSRPKKPILAIKANAGQTVKKGDVIIVLEAMKMENDIVAPQDGTMASISCAVGDAVEAGALLASLN